MAFTFGFNVGPKTLGIDFSVIDTTAKHVVGTVAYDSKGRKLIYVKVSGSIGLGNFAKAAAADDPYTDVVIGTASGAATKVLGMAPQALTTGTWAWLVQKGIFEDDAQLVSANLTNGQPVICDANGDADIALAADIHNAVGVCLIDDTDNTGTLWLDC